MQIINAVITCAFACIIGDCKALGERNSALYEFVNVTYDFAGSQWGSAANATVKGAYIIENNVIAGVNEYKGTVFVCVPRWRPGVPSTLNAIVPPGPGES